MPSVQGQGSFWGSETEADHQRSNSNAVGAGLSGGTYPSMANFLTYPYDSA